MAEAASRWASDWIPLECIVTLENGWGTDFQASQCIPMGSNLMLTLTLPLRLMLDAWCGYTLRVYSDLMTMMCFFLSSCANSYIGDNATYLWWHAHNVKNLSMGPKWLIPGKDVQKSLPINRQHKKIPFNIKIKEIRLRRDACLPLIRLSHGQNKTKLTDLKSLFDNVPLSGHYLFYCPSVLI